MSWRIVEERDSQGRKIRRYVWDRNYSYLTGDQNGAPEDTYYVDTQGRAIQLWGEHRKDPNEEADHGYQIVEVNREGNAEHANQTGAAPPSFVTYGDTRMVLESAGYREHFLNAYPEHWSGHDFSKSASPTLHITLFLENRSGRQQLDERRLSKATFHVDKHTQAGTWKDFGRHLKDVTREVLERKETSKHPK